MHRLIKLSLRLAIIFVISLAIVKPFNWFCQITQKCEPFYFSYHFLLPEGKKKIDVEFGAINYREDLLFTVDTPILETVINRKNTVTYRAKNLSKRAIYFRPILLVEPESAMEHIIRYECPCSRKYKLKKGGEIEMKMTFRLTQKAVSQKVVSDYKKSGDANKKIKILYRVK